jgi:dolichyl-phosphate-mannose-protein mannosyltransferase
MRHILEYSEGVPRFDACKPGENGSPALHWPLGGKTINYRWERNEVDGLSKVSYTYLVTNPVVWLGALVGLVLSWGLLIAHALVGLPGVDRRLLGWIALACALHLGYMVSILQVERVMYLYHYLLPLCFALLNLGLLFSLLFREGLFRGDWHPRLNLAGYAALVLAGFLYFAPFTYGWPLDEAQVERRAWLSVWKLEPVR